MRFHLDNLPLWVLPIFAAIAVAGLAEPIEAPKDCVQCGMDRIAHAKSRMFIAYVDSTTSGICSLFCAEKDSKVNSGKKIRSLQVADYSSTTLIDATNAIWVVGGNVKGGMNRPAKWAFAKDQDAQSFIIEHGGEITPFDKLTSLSGALSAAANQPPDMHPAVAEEKYQPLVKQGSKVPLGPDHYFTFEFDKTPKMGTAIMRVEIFTNDGKQDTTSFTIKGEVDMPAMRGAHNDGVKDFALSKKGVYLMPTRLVMPGEWEVRFMFSKEGKPVFRGAYVFSI